MVKPSLLYVCVKENVIPEEQYGFLPGCSTVWQLLSVLEDWYESVDKDQAAQVAFLDISKAFDRVDHKILIAKLKSIGVIGPSLRWLSSYLNSWLINMSINHVDSLTKPISSSVPQDSVLGPFCS